MITFFTSIARAATISASIPGTTANSTSSAPGAFVANFYQFALLIAGILAFGVVVYGGIRYMASPGNPSGQSEAKEWIWGALLGLLLLAGAYLILNVINPQLVNLNLPTLNSVTVASSSLLSNTPAESTSYGCVADDGVIACGSKSDCSDVTNNACEGKACTQYQASLCGKPLAPSGTSYGCLASDNVVACGKQPDCSDAKGCTGKSCSLFVSSMCGQTLTKTQ